MARLPIDGTPVEARFGVLVESIEPGLRRALIAAYGPELGAEAAADALAWAWEHFDRLERIANPAGYLWRVGQSAVRRQRRRNRPPRSWSVGTVESGTGIEPALASSLARLSPRQRAALLLVHGYGYHLAEAAELMGCETRTLRNHLDRGLTKVRKDLGVTDAEH